MVLSLNSNVAEIEGIGNVYAQKLQKLGLRTVKDLLFYFPRRWDDFSKITPIAQAKINENVSVKGVIFDLRVQKSRHGKIITEAIISDNSGSLKAVWFNQPYLAKILEKRDEIFLAGKLEWSYGQISMVSPVWEKVVEEESFLGLRHVGRIIPVYPETNGITSRWLRSKIGPLLKLVYSIKDYLPEDIKKKHNLIDLAAAIRAMHFPESQKDLQNAQERIKFDKLFCLLLAVLSNRKEVQKERAISIIYDKSIGKKFVDSLPFKLTNSQRQAAREILQDLTKTTPMNRLLEGDVGSGKTVVAALASLMVAKRGYQVALLAPTEVLAQQHYKEFQKLLSGFNIKIALLTGSTGQAEKKHLLAQLAENEINVVIGTHALLSEDIKFWTLGLAIIDEQHRFGVNQRMKLRKTSKEQKALPHFLSMSATPIPRTLAITIFGDLDISVLNEMPKGRIPVSTYLVPPHKRKDGYRFVEEKIKEGRQVFVICPLVSSSDKLGVKSVLEEADNLKNNIFPQFQIGVLHGRLKSKEKEKIMKDFIAGKINILVSTSVVEVGINVPNASIMVVEGAERFGLAQLHQFRGRVGRGNYKSYCFLFTNSWSEQIRKRLKALISSRNGFELAEKDLEIRGPGELLGTAQHGKLDDILNQVINDPSYISSVRKTAQDFLDKFDLGDYPKLLEKVSEYNLFAKLE